jgi:hypothetical protein
LAEALAKAEESARIERAEKKKPDDSQNN